MAPNKYKILAFLNCCIIDCLNYIFRCCLNTGLNIPVKEYSMGTKRDLIYKVALKPLYIPFLGMKCLLHPEDKEQRDIHWEEKVTNMANITNMWFINVCFKMLYRKQ